MDLEKFQKINQNILKENIFPFSPPFHFFLDGGCWSRGTEKASTKKLRWAKKCVGIEFVPIIS